MPKFTRKRHRKRPKGRKKRRTSKLADKKINTLIEKRILEIAKKEDSKQLDKRILRQYVRGTYTALTRVFNGVTCINGLLDEVSQVRKSDGIGSMDIQGKRLGNRILIDGFQLMFKYQLPENNSQATWSDCNVYYCLAMVTDEWEPVSSSSYVPQSVNIDDILPFYPFGYSPKLDQHEDAIVNRRKKRVLIKGSVSITSTEMRAKSGNVKRFLKLKNPIPVDYATSDSSTSQNPLNQKFFLVFRTNVPTTAPADMQPFITSCLKTYYHEPL